MLLQLKRLRHLLPVLGVGLARGLALFSARRVHALGLRLVHVQRVDQAVQLRDVLANRQQFVTQFRTYADVNNVTISSLWRWLTHTSPGSVLSRVNIPIVVAPKK